MGNSLISMLNGIPERLNRRSRRHLINGRHHLQRKSGPHNHPRKYQMLFNIHNPNQDHRARG
jgi:hypothetical protein